MSTIYVSLIRSHSRCIHHRSVSVPKTSNDRERWNANGPIFRGNGMDRQSLDYRTAATSSDQETATSHVSHAAAGQRQATPPVAGAWDYNGHKLHRVAAQGQPTSVARLRSNYNICRSEDRLAPNNGQGKQVNHGCKDYRMRQSM